MKTVAVVYTSMGGLVKTMKDLLKEKLPGWKIVNIADDSLINDVIEAGEVTNSVKNRLMDYFHAAAQLKPEIIVSACSSVGEIAEYADSVMDVPILRIDHAMVEKAVAMADRIGVLASLGTTMEPTCSYIERLAEGKGKQVQVVGVIATGAYQANAAGDAQTHDRLILEAAEQVKDQVDLILLAQGSMAKLEAQIKTRTGLPVLSSPGLCVEEILEKYSGTEG